MGVELNPRIGDFDIKMFFIGRIGNVISSSSSISFLFLMQSEYILFTNYTYYLRRFFPTGMIGWAIVILSHAAAQFETYGYVSNSMVLLIVLQMIYIIDWAWKEAWYTQTLGKNRNTSTLYLIVLTLIICIFFVEQTSCTIILAFSWLTVPHAGS